MLEISLKEADDFLKIKETLTRIGIASQKNKILYQSCHILHKQSKYYIVHFKELFLLDGKQANFEENDLGRRNSIAKLLSEWGLLTIVSEEELTPLASLNEIKIIAFKDKQEWKLEPKYNIGAKK